MAAVTNVGRICAACPTGFLPYVSQTLKCMRGLANHFHEEVKIKAIEAMRNLMLGVFELIIPT